MITLLDPSQYKRTPWKNGGGTTTTIAEQDGIWQFGRTPITQPGRFSDYTGFDRAQVLVRGHGLLLLAPDGAINVRLPFRPVRFAGETPITSHLEAGAVEVVNLIGKRSDVTIDLVMLAPGKSASLGKGTHLAYAATGAARVGGHDLPADHCLRLETDQPTILACGGGLIVLGSILCVSQS
jgi:environmental stress-induced protein Ves